MTNSSNFWWFLIGYVKYLLEILQITKYVHGHHIVKCDNIGISPSYSSLVAHVEPLDLVIEQTHLVPVLIFPPSNDTMQSMIDNELLGFYLNTANCFLTQLVFSFTHRFIF